MKFVFAISTDCGTAFTQSEMGSKLPGEMVPRRSAYMLQYHGLVCVCRYAPRVSQLMDLWE